jgi:hypothetical protein
MSGNKSCGPKDKSSSIFKGVTIIGVVFAKLSGWDMAKLFEWDVAKVSGWDVAKLSWWDVHA